MDIEAFSHLLEDFEKRVEMKIKIISNKLNTLDDRQQTLSDEIGMLQTCKADREMTSGIVDIRLIDAKLFSLKDSIEEAVNTTNRALMFTLNKSLSTLRDMLKEKASCDDLQQIKQIISVKSVAETSGSSACLSCSKRAVQPTRGILPGSSHVRAPHKLFKSFRPRSTPNKIGNPIGLGPLLQR